MFDTAIRERVPCVLGYFYSSGYGPDPFDTCVGALAQDPYVHELYQFAIRLNGHQGSTDRIATLVANLNRKRSKLLDPPLCETLYALTLKQIDATKVCLFSVSIAIPTPTPVTHHQHTHTARIQLQDMLVSNNNSATHCKLTRDHQIREKRREAGALYDSFTCNTTDMDEAEHSARKEFRTLLTDLKKEKQSTDDRTMFKNLKLVVGGKVHHTRSHLPRLSFDLPQSVVHPL